MLHFLTVEKATGVLRHSEHCAGNVEGNEDPGQQQPEQTRTGKSSDKIGRDEQGGEDRERGGGGEVHG